MKFCPFLTLLKSGIVLVIVLSTFWCEAQDTITTKNGKTYEGVLLKYTSKRAVIATQINNDLHRISFPRDEIQKVKGVHVQDFISRTADTLILDDSRKIYGKLITEDSVQYYLYQYKARRVKHLSVLKSGVSVVAAINPARKYDLPQFVPPSDKRRLWNFGFYFSKAFNVKSATWDFGTQPGGLDFGFNVESRINHKSKFSIAFLPGISNNSINEKVLYVRIDSVYVNTPSNLTYFQFPFQFRFHSAGTSGLMAGAGIHVGMPAVDLKSKNEWGPFVGPFLSAGYGLKIGMGDSMRLEYFISQRQKDVWMSGLKLTFSFGCDKYLTNIIVDRNEPEFSGPSL